MIEALRQLPETHAVTRRYLIGVSGGVDSVILLRCLHELGYRHLIVSHLNHGLRGRASSEDARFVRRLAAQLGFEVVIGCEDVEHFARKEKLSVETAARHLRYRFFARIAREKRCRRLFLAHHADDQVETVLMSLFRGSGSRGLGGMREISQQKIGSLEINVLRPLLGVWREDLDLLAKEKKWRFREDASNEDRAFLRNCVRHSVIPELSAHFRRDIRPLIERLARQSRSESDYLDSLVESDAGEDTLSVARLRNLHPALQRRLLFLWLKRQGVADVDFDLVQQARDLISPGAAVAKMNLPRDRHLRRRQGVLFVE